MKNVRKYSIEKISKIKLAERRRFELLVQENYTPLFESGTFNHSDTSPCFAHRATDQYYSLNVIRITFDVVRARYSSIMSPTTQALRAVTGVYFRRLLGIVVIIGGTAMILVYALLFWLGTSVSPLWWFFLIILIPITGVLAGIGGGLWYASGKLLPRRLTKTERQAVTTFGSKLFGIVERGRMPYPVLLIMVGKDVLRRRESTFLKQFISDSRTLKDDFSRIRDMFA